MLRLPHIRDVLASEPTDMLGEMLEAYALAAETLDRFRLQRPQPEALISEYAELCRDIEHEIQTYCAALQAAGQKI